MQDEISLPLIFSTLPLASRLSDTIGPCVIPVKIFKPSRIREWRRTTPPNRTRSAFLSATHKAPTPSPASSPKLCCERWDQRPPQPSNPNRRFGTGLLTTFRSSLGAVRKPSGTELAASHVIYWTSTSKPSVPPCAASVDLSHLRAATWLRGLLSFNFSCEYSQRSFQHQLSE